MEILLIAPFVALVLLALACGMVGVQVVHHRMAFFSDAVSHSAFTGVALATLFHIDAFFMMLGIGLLFATLLTHLKTKTHYSHDALVGVLYAFLVALGIVLVSSQHEHMHDHFGHVLFGDIDGATAKDAWLFGLLVVGLFIYNMFTFNSLLSKSVHSELSRLAKQTPLNSLLLLNLLVSLVVMLSIKAVGVLLVTALLVIPAATARALATTARQLFWGSILVSTVSAVFGYALSLLIDCEVGAAVVVTAGFCFFATHLFSLKKI